MEHKSIPEYYIRVLYSKRYVFTDSQHVFFFLFVCHCYLLPYICLKISLLLRITVFVMSQLFSFICPSKMLSLLPIHILSRNALSVLKTFVRCFNTLVSHGISNEIVRFGKIKHFSFISHMNGIKLCELHYKCLHWPRPLYSEIDRVARLHITFCDIVCSWALKHHNVWKFNLRISSGK